MPAWSWVVIGAAVVILVALAVVIALSINRRKRTERLKKHFGPEYERAVDDAGDHGAAEKELVARQRKRQKLDIVALAPESRARYAENWRGRSS
jgi:anti-sigma-K factor RskA